ncbi:unnamed protein product [Clavelina lepadiformis]|uniref:Uncharacterized protein n=1 Tax=Clavelina lepadiformis TaxID=159417 RepID=A0ABP0GCL0_CLALP
MEPHGEMKQMIQDLRQEVDTLRESLLEISRRRQDVLTTIIPFAPRNHARVLHAEKEFTSVDIVFNATARETPTGRAQVSAPESITTARTRIGHLQDTYHLCRTT